MEKLEVTKLSSRGQMVIPQSLRSKMGLEEGQQFVVMGEGDTLIFKKMEMPSMKSIRKLLEVSQKHARQAGLTQKDVTIAIQKVRREKKVRAKTQ